MRARALLLCALFAPPLGAAPDDDEEAPHISHDDIAVTVAGQDLAVTAKIDDPSGVFDPTVLYRVGDEGAFLRAPMEPAEEPGSFRATIPGNLVVGDIQYFIEAFDELGNGPARYGDQELPLRVRVVAPTVQDPGEESGAGSAGGKAPAKEKASGQDGGVAEEAEEGSSLGLWLGVGGAGAGALVVAGVVAAVAGGIGAYYVINNMNNNTPGEVTVVVTGPSVTPAALAPAGAPR